MAGLIGADPARVHAVLVGIARYPRVPSLDLPGAAADAVRFARWLRDRGVPPENIALLLSAEAERLAELRTEANEHGLEIRPIDSRDQVMDVFTQQTAAQEGDLLFVYWGGHGVLGPDGQRVLVCPDASAADLRAIELDGLRRYLTRRDVAWFGRQVLLVDTCAQFFEDLNQPSGPAVAAFLPGPRASADQFVLHAAADGQVAGEDPARRSGRFSTVLLDWLESHAPTVEPDLTVLLGHVKEHFNALARAGKPLQTPVTLHIRTIDGDIEDFTVEPTGTTELDRLRELSRVAAEDASVVVQAGPRYPRGVHLTDLYVRRELEDRLHRRLGEPGGQVVIGEAGCGKTSVLWGLHRALSAENDVEPLLVKASYLLEGMREESARGPRGLTLPEVERALRQCVGQGLTPVLLVDTLDLLMHSSDSRRLVAELLRLAQRSQVSAVLTCRPGEAALLPLDDEDAEGYLRSPLTLGPYSATEQPEAVRGHCRAFCPSDDSDGPGGDSAARVHDLIMNAVYLDLPLREVCDNPLTLRLLFDLYAPDVPVKDVDVASLYDTMWQRRVERDSRAGEDDPAADQRAALPLQATAEALARYLLAANTLEVEAGVAETELRRLLPPEASADIPRDLRVLQERGILTVVDSNRLRFFHQTFFEHAAARYLLTADRGRELVDRILREPDDLLLAAVAGQLLPRVSPVQADLLLRPLLADDRTVTLGLSIYAGQRTPGKVREFARQVLAEAPAESVKRFLLLLPGLRHPDPRRWAEDLTAVWHCTARPDAPDAWVVRIRLVEALCRLARRQPAAALDFVLDAKVMDWLLDQRAGDLRNHQRVHLALLCSVFAEDPDWSLCRFAEFWQRYVKDRQPGGLPEIVEELHRAIDRLSDAPLKDRTARQALTRCEELLGSLAGWINSTAVEFEIGRLWAAVHHGLGPATVRELMLAALNETGPERLHRARLHGLGRLADHLPQAEAASVVTALRAITRPGPQTTVLDTVIVPVLRRETSARPGLQPLVAPTPFSNALTALCREALDLLPAPLVVDGARSFPTWLLEAVSRAELDGPGLLAVLPAVDSHPRWLEPDGLGQLLVLASVAGHPGARAAFDAWCRNQDTRQAFDAKRLRKAISVCCDKLTAAHPELLDHLVDEAALTCDPTRLITALDIAGNADRSQVIAVVRAASDRFEALLTALQDGGRGSRTTSYRLLRALIDHAGWPSPSGRVLAADLPPDSPQLRRIGVLEVARSTLRAGGWTFEQAEPLVPTLTALAGRGDGEPAPGSPAGAQQAEPRDSVPALAHHTLVALHCRLSPIGSAEQRKRLWDTVIPLVIPKSPAHGKLVSEDARELGRLIERTALVEPAAAAELLLGVSAALHGYDPAMSKPKREIANRWDAPIQAVVQGLGAAGRRGLMSGLVTGDTALARKTIEILAKEMVTEPPQWFRALASREDLPRVLRETVSNRLRLHARSYCSSTWPELLDSSDG
ncbi:caspase family protein [Kitasatospora aureofaciens]|uniref:caspase family protein n=1 Tax=Kitasatospora aureofaciens TaxID=1894 RepID=UPI001C475C73|nr:caspase family protein [Kitasatospora aureofaciens]MBV6702613.1 caspase family protein [Kitasatospora aureofaciens]